MTSSSKKRQDTAPATFSRAQASEAASIKAGSREGPLSISLDFVSSNYFIVLKGPGMRSRQPSSATLRSTLQSVSCLFCLAVAPAACYRDHDNDNECTLQRATPECSRKATEKGRPGHSRTDNDFDIPCSWQASKQAQKPPASPVHWLTCTALNTSQLSPMSWYRHSHCAYTHTHTHHGEEARQRAWEPLYQPSGHHCQMTWQVKWDRQ